MALGRDSLRGMREGRIGIGYTSVIMMLVLILMYCYCYYCDGRTNRTDGRTDAIEIEKDA
jgi:hypothetical protein